MKNVFIFYDSKPKPREIDFPVCVPVNNPNDGIQVCLRISKETGFFPVGFTYVDTDEPEEQISIWFNGKIKCEKGKEYIFIGDDFGIPKEEKDCIVKINI